MSREASENVTIIPARYEMASEQVIDVAAHTIWKKGVGPIQKIDEATGEIMCLIEVPATYKTISRRALNSAASTEQVMVPAVYKTVNVTKLVAGAQESRVEVPAEYNTVVSQELEQEGFMEWRSILCKTNMTAGTVGNIQRALMQRDYTPGSIDAVIGADIIQAINAFQRDEGLPVDKYINMETIKALGVDL